MKTFNPLFVLLFPMLVVAQSPNEKIEFSKEQRLELHTKKMQLELDLTEKQVSAVRSALKKYQLERPEKIGKSNMGTSDQHYKMMMKRMDTQIALQNEMKSILNEEQFVLWKKNKPQKRMASRHHNKRGGHNPNKEKHHTPLHKRN